MKYEIPDILIIESIRQKQITSLYEDQRIQLEIPKPKHTNENQSINKEVQEEKRVIIIDI